MIPKKRPSNSTECFCKSSYNRKLDWKQKCMYICCPKKVFQSPEWILKQRFPGVYVQSFPTNTIPTTWSFVSVWRSVWNFLFDFGNFPGSLVPDWVEWPEPQMPKQPWNIVVYSMTKRCPSTFLIEILKTFLPFWVSLKGLIEFCFT